MLRSIIQTRRHNPLHGWAHSKQSTELRRHSADLGWRLPPILSVSRRRSLVVSILQDMPMSPPVSLVQTAETLPAAVDVAVIGGGMAGVATAFELAPGMM
jgi:hypothetical protein